jgi:hypothetical protein
VVGPVDPWGTTVATKGYRPLTAMVTASGADDGYAAKGAIDGDLHTAANIDGDTEVQGGSLFVAAVEDVAVGSIATPDAYDWDVFIPHLDLRPVLLDAGNLAKVEWGVEQMLMPFGAGAKSITYGGSVEVPKGAVIVGFELEARRDNVAHTINCTFYSTPTGAGAGTTLCTVTHTGTGRSIASAVLSETVGDFRYAVQGTFAQTAGGAASQVGIYGLRLYLQKGSYKYAN